MAINMSALTCAVLPYAGAVKKKAQNYRL